MVMKFCISNKTCLSNRVKKEGEKRQLWCQKKKSAKWFDELAKAFRIMPSSTLLIEVWKVLHRVYEVQTKRK